MAQTAAHLVDRFIPHVPVRQWVLSPPIPLRLLLAAQPKLVHFRPMFGSYGGAMHRTSLTFVSQAAMRGELGDAYGLKKRMAVVQ